MRRKNIKGNKHLFQDGSILNQVQDINYQQYVSNPNIQNSVVTLQGQQLQNLDNIGKSYSTSGSNFNMGQIGGIVNAAGTAMNTINTPTQNIYDAVYSDGSQDPIGRFINDVTGRNTQTAINQVNQSRVKNTNAKTLDDVAQMYANYSTMPLLRRSKNNAFNAIGLTAVGAPWLSYNQSGKLSFDAGNIKSFGQGASKGSQFGGPWGALWGGVAGGLFNVFSRFGQNRRIRKINKAIKNVNAYNQRALENQKTNVLQDNMSNMMRNYAAYGGPILGALDYEIANKNLNNYADRTSANAASIIPYFQALNTFGDGGSIDIKPSKKGTFTAAAKRRGMGVQEFASKVLANKENYSSAMIKKANFARNAAKWHGEGGPIKDGDITEQESFWDKVDKYVDDAEGALALTDAGLLGATVIAPNPVTPVLGYGTSVLGGLADIYQGIRSGIKGDYANMAKNVGELGLSLIGAKAFKAAEASKDLYKSAKASDLLTPVVKKTINPRYHGKRGQPKYFKHVTSQEFIDAQNNYLKSIGIIVPNTISNFLDFSDSKQENTKAFGGNLLTHGGEWTNGLTWFNNGSTHEENPNGGIPQGIAPDGKPNLVEEGEVKYNDYIFSNRLTVPEDMTKKYKLKDNTTFANAIKKLSKEAEERPNDNISKNYLNSVLNDLIQSQEEVRLTKQQEEQYANGGHLFAKGSGLFTDFANKRIFDWEIQPVTPGGTPFANIYDANAVTPEEQAKSNIDESKATWLRYAPVLGSTIGLTTGLFSKPNYGNAKRIEDAAKNAGQYTPISYNPLGDYLSYNPLDINYIANQLRASEQAAARNILNTSGGNRGTAMAGLLSNTYNSQLALGNAYRQAMESSLAQRQQVGEFNRETNKLNSLGFLEADKANQEAQLKSQAQYLEGIERGALTRQAIKDARDASLSANFTNLFNSLGDIGREAYSRNMVNMNPALYYSIKNGKVTYKNGFDDLSEYEKSLVREDAEKKIKRKGGYLTINR